MIRIPYGAMVALISVLWCINRAMTGWKNKKFDWKRELQLLLVYICIVVIVRFTFCPFGKVDGKIQPLILDLENIWPFRINLIPFIYMADYEIMREAVLNFVGNTLMFVPVGVVYPIVYKNLNNHKKVLAAGVGFSLVIEILQLPFYSRVSDIDDIILNSLGYVLGYLIYLGIKKIRNRKKVAKIKH